MAIGYRGGQKSNSSGVSSAMVGYTPLTGNIVFVFLNLASSVTTVTCKDSNNVSLTAGPTVVNTCAIYSFYYTVPASAPSSFTPNWGSNKAYSITIVEYSGATSVGTSNFNSGSSNAPTITMTTQDANNWMVASLGDSSNTITYLTGNSRESVIVGAAEQITLDNTRATTGSLTCAGTMISTTWVAVYIELRLILGPIQYVQSAKGGGTAATSAVVTISPAAGNLVVIGIALLLTSDSVSGITDSVGSTKYTFLTAINNSTAARIELWTGRIVGSPTTITVSFAITTAEVVIAEYSGVAVLGINKTGTASSTSASLTQTNEDNYNYMVEVAAAGGNTTFASGTGTLRNSGTQNLVIGCALADNMATTQASVTVAITLGTSLANAEAMVELRTVPPLFVEPNDEVINNNVINLGMLSLLEEGVDLVISPPVPAPNVGYDNDGENQILNPLYFSSDTLMDEGVEFITLPPFVSDLDEVMDEDQ